MPKICFSDVGLRNLPAPERGQIDYWDTSFKAGVFGCRVSQGGTKTFQIKNRNRRITIGKYPAISLQDARGEAKRLLAEITLGRVHPEAVTFVRALDLFIEEKTKARRPSTVAGYKRLLNNFGFNGKLSELTHDEAQRRLKRFRAPAEYNHMLVALKILCNWAMKRRYIEHNPTVGLSGHARVKRARVLSDAELKAVWGICADGANELPAHFRAIVKLLICTGQRRGEIAGLQVQFLDLRNMICTLPASLTKNHTVHAFPLGSLALSLLCGLPDAGLLFPARGKPEKPFNGWSKSKDLLDALSGVTDWTLHDLRRTFRTNLGRLGVRPDIAERLVNHISARSEMEEVYDRHTYLDEMRAGMALWEGKLQSLLDACQLAA